MTNEYGRKKAQKLKKQTEVLERTDGDFSGGKKMLANEWGQANGKTLHHSFAKPSTEAILMQVGVLIIATRNKHKVGEIRAILGEQFRLVSLEDFPGAPEVIEDAPTFAGNATKKSVELANWLSASGRPHAARPATAGEHAFVLADDSGLEVDALSDAPGVHSARFAALDTGKAGNSSDADNRKKLLRLLSAVPAARRTARFRCVLALTPVPERKSEPASQVCYADEAELQTRLFNGVCEGSIITEARGAGGFGYDPLFIPSGYDQTFGELAEDVKNRLSHRARALAAMKAALLCA